MIVAAGVEAGESMVPDVGASRSEVRGRGSVQGLGIGADRHEA